MRRPRDDLLREPVHTPREKGTRPEAEPLAGSSAVQRAWSPQEQAAVLPVCLEERLAWTRLRVPAGKAEPQLVHSLQTEALPVRVHKPQGLVQAQEAGWQAKLLALPERPEVRAPDLSGSLALETRAWCPDGKLVCWRGPPEEHLTTQPPACLPERRARLARAPP